MAGVLEPCRSVASEGALWFVFLGFSVGQLVGTARGAPRRGVSCGRGAGDGCDGETDRGTSPILGGRTGRRHGDLDAADADANQRTDLEELEPDGAASRLREVGIVEADARYGLTICEAERLSRRLTMGANEPVAPASLLQVAGTGRIVREKSLELWQRLWEPKIATLVKRP